MSAKKKALEGTVESFVEAGNPADLPRGFHLRALAKAGFYLNLKDGTQRLILQEVVDRIVFESLQDLRNADEAA